MSQAYKVAQAFQATVSKEDKTPKTVEFDGHVFNAWKVKLEGETDKGWINVNKKPGNEIKPGDELYGDINQIDGKFGTFYNFKSASRPLGEAPTQAAAPASSSSELDGTVHEKLDHIIALLESVVLPDGVAKVFPGAEPTTAPDLDDLDI
jgi:hypothetical protein